MLVLSRKIGEQIVIGDCIVVTVVAAHGDRVRLGVSAPAAMPIHREEVWKRINSSVAACGENSDLRGTPSRLRKDFDEPAVSDEVFVPGTAAHAACEQDYLD